MMMIWLQATILVIHVKLSQSFCQFSSDIAGFHCFTSRLITKYIHVSNTKGASLPANVAQLVDPTKNQTQVALNPVAQ